MTPDQAARELAELDALIAAAAAELAALQRRLGRLDAAAADPGDPIGCLLLWLAALRQRRDQLLRGGAG